MLMQISSELFIELSSCFLLGLGSVVEEVWHLRPADTVDELILSILTQNGGLRGLRTVFGNIWRYISEAAQRAGS